MKWNMHLPFEQPAPTPNGREVHVAEPLSDLLGAVFTRCMGGYHRGVAVIAAGKLRQRQQARRSAYGWSVGENSGNAIVQA